MKEKVSNIVENYHKTIEMRVQLEQNKIEIKCY